MKPSHRAETPQPAQSNYAPSVPMSVYRELAAELRANRAVIDSLNSRNQQLLQQNQLLKQEIHNVVQATLHLGQYAGVARPANSAGFMPERGEEAAAVIASETLAKLARKEALRSAEEFPEEATVGMPPHSMADLSHASPFSKFGEEQAQAGPAAFGGSTVTSIPPRNRLPKPIPDKKASLQPSHKVGLPPTPPADFPQPKGPQRATQKGRPSTPSAAGRQMLPKRSGPASAKPLAVPGAGIQAPRQKLFTEQPSGFRSSVLDREENKEIGGIWLVLSIILIIVTAFGAGFLIMKPLLNDR